MLSWRTAGICSRWYNEFGGYIHISQVYMYLYMCMCTGRYKANTEWCHTDGVKCLIQSFDFQNINLSMKNIIEVSSSLPNSML